jgi:hypothetical protein
MSDKKVKAEIKSLNIYQRINAVMGEVKYIQKDSKAAKGLPYKFVSHDQVTGTLHAPMQKHGIVMVTDILELKQDGNRTEAKVGVTFVNIDNPEDRFSTSFYGYGVCSQDKGPGKAISYAVKYCLLKTFCLETGDDVERDNIDHKPAALTPISSHELQTLEILINGHHDIREKVLTKCNGQLSNLTLDQYPNVVKWVYTEILEKKSTEKA